LIHLHSQKSGLWRTLRRVRCREVQINITSIFDWFAQDSAYAAEHTDEPRQRSMWLQLAEQWEAAALHGTRRPNCITRVGEIFRVGQRAARPVPEGGLPFPSETACSEPVQGRRRALRRERPRLLGTRASRVGNPVQSGGFSRHALYWARTGIFSASAEVALPILFRSASMPIRSLLAETRFNLEQTEMIGKAFDDAWAKVKIDEAEPAMASLVRTALAKGLSKWHIALASMCKAAG
jgi:hypothetical protein